VTPYGTELRRHSSSTYDEPNLSDLFQITDEADPSSMERINLTESHYWACGYSAEPYGFWSNPRGAVKEWGELQTDYLRADVAIVGLNTAGLVLLPARARGDGSKFEILADFAYQTRRDDNELEKKTTPLRSALPETSQRVMMAQIDHSEKRLLEELSPDYGGVSGVIRHALQLLTADRRRRKALESFLQDWDDEAGPVDEAGVAEMARRYRL